MRRCPAQCAGRADVRTRACTRSVLTGVSVLCSAPCDRGARRLEFHLTRPPGTAERGRSLRLDDFTATITSADLAPASVLNCHVAEASAASSSGPPFLRADLMELAQELETIE